MIKTINNKRYLQRDNQWIDVSTGQILTKLPIEKWVEVTQEDVDKCVGQFTAIFHMKNTIEKQFLLGENTIIKEVDGELRKHVGIDNIFASYIANSNASFKDVGFTEEDTNIWSKDSYIIDTNSDKISVSKVGSSKPNLKSLLKK